MILGALDERARMQCEDVDAPAAPRSAQLEGDGTPVVGSALYASKSYWDKRFETEDSKEWLCSFDDVRVLLEKLLPSDRDARILLVGCGTSDLGADLHNELGFTHVVCSDYSETCVAHMSAKHASLAPAVSYFVADMLDLGAAFAEACFDVVIDKAAFDAVVADGGADKWTPTDEAREAAARLSESVAGILRTGGRFVQITFSQPHFRRPLLLAGDASPWSGCESHDVDVGFGYACLVLDRKAR
jgi:SAM-dependent methyltransferase